MKLFHWLALSLFFFAFTPTFLSQSVFMGEEAHLKIKGAEIVRESSHSEIPSYIKFRTGKEIDFDNIVVWIKKNLKLNPKSELKLMNELQDQFGHIHYKFQQTENGLPVQFAQWIVHTVNDHVYALNGMLHSNISNSSPSLTEEQALQLALNHVNAETYKWEIPAEEAHIKAEQVLKCNSDGACEIQDQNDLRNKIAARKLACAGHTNNLASYYPNGTLLYAPKKGTYRAQSYKLVWKFNIYAHQPVSRSEVYVDAVNGEIILENEIIHEADVTGTAETAYSGTRTITTDSFGGSYRLRESGRGNGINTYDMNENTTYGSAVDFTDTDNYWDNVNAEQDEVATDAHWGAEMTYDYFLNQHSRNSIDGAGFALNSYVHYDNAYANAFWDGNRMTYGDGGGGWTALTALDIAGHEIGHGLCTFSANLVYQDESGALNESFSDIWGTSIENFARPSNWNWLIGEDIGSALRSMSNPNSAGDPDTYFGTNWAPLGGGDNGGVHTNSGVQNYWYYLLTDGGSGTNDNGDGYAITGQGFTKSSQIAFRNLTVYLTNNSEFADARFYSIMAATDLFGGCSPEVEATTNAWYAVGVGTPYSSTVTANFNAPIVSACSAPMTVDFSNLSSNGVSFSWNFGDGASSSVTSPSHTYSSLGNYTVQLLVDGGDCGVDSITLVDYISIDSTLPCITILPTSGTSDIQTACSGTIFDSGGASSPYGADEDAQITITPTGATTVDLTFPSFDIEPGSSSNCDYDWLELYDGNSTAAPLIDRYCNDNPPTGTISSSGGSITLVFHSDPGLELDGFQVDWNCVLSTAAPSANFTSNVTTTCTGEVNYSDLSTNGPTSWLWNFGDGNISSLQNPSHTYSTNGTYTVELTASNVNGSDILTQTNYIIVNMPSAPVATGDSICEGETTDLIATGGSNLSWYDSSVGGALIGAGSTYTTPILTSSTTFYVQEDVLQTPQNVGPIDNSFGGGGYFNGNQHLFFDVYTPVQLVSVWVDAQGTSDRTIELRDNTGTVIQSAVINVPDGESRITLNFDLPVGTNFQLGTLNGSSPSLFRNNSGPSYPYDLPGILSITGSSASVAGYYYFFYDWEVQEPNCTSARVPVDVIVSPLSDATINPQGPFCESASPITLTAATSGGIWSGPGVIAGNFDPSAAGLGTHTITYTILGSCGSTDTENITVTSALDATIASVGPLCDGSNAITLSAATSGGTWFGNGVSSNQFDPSIAGVGQHEIIYSIPGTCGNSDTAYIDVLTASDATIAALGPFCENDPAVSLTAIDGGGTWSGSGVSSNLFNPASAGAGNHIITYTISGTCGDMDTVMIQVNIEPDPTITPVGPLCDGSPIISLSAASPGGNWTGTGVSTDQFDPSIAGLGIHNITYSISGSCAASDSIQIEVLEQADATINTQGPFCETDGFVVLTAANSGGNWSGNGVTGNIFDPSSAGIGSHLITYVIPGFCGDADSLDFLVESCTGIAEDFILSEIRLFPNPSTTQFIIELSTWTPGTVINIQLLNNLGQLVMEKLSKDAYTPISVSELNSGTYIVKLTVENTTIYKKVMIY
ncbi:MAG: PKD domain-containing protein [Crocinitomicaceae bacterium]|nr:PKD domain-containing protein [Crocinitomicaceae bacterium]